MRIGILTYGCAVNRSDTETIAGILKASGHEVVFDSEEPELVVVNTCIVKGPTENKIIRKLQDLEENGKRVIVAGCMPQAYPDVAKHFPAFEFMGTEPESIAQFISGGSEKIEKLRVNKFIEIIPICDGCLGACAYCATKLARGNLKSRSVDEIVDVVQKAVDDGVVEVWLTAQDTGCYGFDIGTNLAELLRKVDALDGDFRIRVGMMNPEHALKILDDLVDAYKSEKVYKFLHLPLQSGSDAVLKLMNRGYSVDDFMSVVSAFRKEIDITVSTDVIVGFPGEEEEDFKETLDIIDKLRPEVMNISKYWKRRDTIASYREQVPVDIIKDRGKSLSAHYSKISAELIKEKVGKSKLLVSETRDDMFVGRTEKYRPVLLQSKEDLLGKFVSGEIVERDGKLIAALS